jgi:hypothetical protein
MRPRPGVEVALGERQRLADPQAGAPERHDQRTDAEAMCAIACAAHDRHDLLHGRWICRIASALLRGGRPQ